MKLRSQFKVERAVSSLPYLMSLSAMVLAVACGKNDDRKEPIRKIDARQAQEQEVNEATKRAAGKLDITADVNQKFMQRLEGATAMMQLAPNSTDKKTFAVEVQLLLQEEDAKKPALQIVGNGILDADYDVKLKAAIDKKDNEEVRKLTRSTFLDLLNNKGSAGTYERFMVRAICQREMACKIVNIVVIEPTATLKIQDMGDIDSESPENYRGFVRRLVLGENARNDLLAGRPIQLKLNPPTSTELGAGRGKEKPTIDPTSVSVRSFEEAKKIRLAAKLEIAPSVSEPKKAQDSVEKSDAACNDANDPACDAPAAEQRKAKQPKDLSASPDVKNNPAASTEHKAGADSDDEWN